MEGKSQQRPLRGNRRGEWHVSDLERGESSDCASTKGRLHHTENEKRTVGSNIREVKFSGMLAVEAKLKWVQE